MKVRLDRRSKRDIWLPATVAGVAAGIAFAIAISPVWDLAGVLTCFCLVPVAAVLLLMYAARVRSWSAMLSPVLLCFLAWSFWLAGYPLRAHARWLLESSQWKARVLAQPVACAGELQHLDWDGWGIAGAETEVYLVFDPNNKLAMAARSKSSGRIDALPVPVRRVDRLEKSWYAVTLYTDEEWQDCAGSEEGQRLPG